MNIHWPATRDNWLLPWYLYAWRAPWLIPAFIGRFIFAVSMGMSALSYKTYYFEMWED